MLNFVGVTLYLENGMTTERENDEPLSLSSWKAHKKPGRTETRQTMIFFWAIKNQNSKRTVWQKGYSDHYIFLSVHMIIFDELNKKGFLF